MYYFINEETFQTLPFMRGAIPDSFPKTTCIGDILTLTKPQIQLCLNGYGKPDNGEEWAKKKKLAVLHGVPAFSANKTFKQQEDSNL